MGKTHYKHLAARHGRGTACYVESAFKVGHKVVTGLSTVNNTKFPRIYSESVIQIRTFSATTACRPNALIRTSNTVYQPFSGRFEGIV